jgi:hypothetical protein
VDAIQPRLGADQPLGVDGTAPVERIALDDGSWIDLGRDWLGGADALFDRLQHSGALRWEQRRRPMFGRMVDEPRLTAEHRADGPGDQELGAIARALAERYRRPLVHLWANWYRDGDDAVAWHADRIGRSVAEPVVAIVTLGGPRDFAMRPAPGHTGGRHRWRLHSGDLLVMGGACQRRWHHSVPRERGGAGRISLTFREPAAGAQATG